MRALLTFSVAACTDAEVSPEPHDVVHASSTIDGPPLFRATFRRETDPPIVAKVRSIHRYPVAGEDCSPSFRLYTSSDQVTENSAHTRLMFHEPLAIGVTAPLPEVATWNTVNSSVHPLMVQDWDGETNNLFGGQVRVVTLDPDLWTLAFEGDGLVTCNQWEEDCVPIEGATLDLEPVDAAGSLPEALDVCELGEPYPWPDGGDGCGVLQSGGPLTECPATFPW